MQTFLEERSIEITKNKQIATKIEGNRQKSCSFVPEEGLNEEFESHFWLYLDRSTGMKWILNT